MKKKTVKKVEIGAGVAAGLAAALAGAYLLYGKGPQHKKAKAWVGKAKKDAAREIKKMKKVGEKEYKVLVAKAMKRYGSLEKASMPEIMQAIQEAHNDWTKIHAQAKKMAVMAAKKNPLKKKSVKRSVSKKTKKAKK